MNMKPAKGYPDLHLMMYLLVTVSVKWLLFALYATL